MVKKMEMLNIFKTVINGEHFELRLNGESVSEVMQKVRNKHKNAEVYFLQMDNKGYFHRIG